MHVALSYSHIRLLQEKLMSEQLFAVGKVESLCVNGSPTSSINILPEGIFRDTHRGFQRALSGHDGAYLKTSALKKGHAVFNWRSWTALSLEELQAIEYAISCSILPGILFENMIISGIPNFSQLQPTSRLVFPLEKESQAILAVWEENGPCRTVGERVESASGGHTTSAEFVRAAHKKRGLMGFVLSPGVVRVGDQIRVYGPVR